MKCVIFNKYNSSIDPYGYDSYNGYVTTSTNHLISTSQAPVRVVKRRNTANKKERRRTLSINTAFSSLRNRIPNVPSDTKMSKVYLYFPKMNEIL